ncbi:hypothetical protein [Pseudomonas sp. DSP3-2-2]|uniref:hypothetical protein n=1 Tax=unclassified Pseudomonas TaxID=196821 RepID=UPI003CEB570E
MTAMWNQIDTFSIESATGNNTLYANGRQSIKVRVAVKVVDVNNKPVILTDRERSTITLVNFHGGKEIKYRDARMTSPVDSQYGDWDWSLTKIGGFSYFPANGAQTQGQSDGSGTQASGTYYVDIYVRSISQTPITLAVRIKRDDGISFDSLEFTSGRLELQPVPRPVYGLSQYRLDKVTVKQWPKNVTGLSGLVALFYHRLVFVTGGENLQFKSVSLSPDGLYAHPDFDVYQASVVGFTEPGNNQISYLYPHAAMPSKLELSPAPGEIFFVETGLAGKSAGDIYQAASKKDTLACTVNAVDVYGNLHQINMRFQTNNSWQPELY